MQTNIYYIYAYIRKNDQTPYYIGKGKGNRAFQKYNKTGKPPKNKSRIIFLHENLEEEKAFELEKHYILLYGRKDLGTGILVNQTNGGDGISGRSEEVLQKIRDARAKQKMIMTDEWKFNISKGNKGKIRSEQDKAQRRKIMKRLWENPEYREKMSKSHKGKPLSEEHKNKIREGVLKHINH